MKTTLFLFLILFFSKNLSGQKDTTINVSFLVGGSGKFYNVANLNES